MAQRSISLWTHFFKKIVPDATTTSYVQTCQSHYFSYQPWLLPQFSCLEFFSICIPSFNSPGLYGQVPRSQKSFLGKKENFLFKEEFIYLFLERGEGREKNIDVRENHRWLASQGPNLQARHVPWPGINPMAFLFAGWCSTSWATPLRARKLFRNESSALTKGNRMDRCRGVPAVQGGGGRTRSSSSSSDFTFLQCCLANLWHSSFWSGLQLLRCKSAS